MKMLAIAACLLFPAAAWAQDIAQLPPPDTFEIAAAEAKMICPEDPNAVLQPYASEEEFTFFRKIISKQLADGKCLKAPADMDLTEVSGKPNQDVEIWIAGEDGKYLVSLQSGIIFGKKCYWYTRTEERFY